MMIGQLPRASLLLLLVVGTIGARAAEPQRKPLAFTCETFPWNLSETDLVARHGEGHVISAPVIGGDDGPQEGTVLFPAIDGARLEIAWEDPISRSRPRWAKAVGRRWITANGITVGTTLRAVEQVNGAPFRLSGFLTEGSGGVRSWGKGRLARSTDPGGCDVDIHFQPAYDDTDDSSLVRQVRFGQEYSSAHPALQKLNPSVVVMWLRPVFRSNIPDVKSSSGSRHPASVRGWKG